MNYEPHAWCLFWNVPLMSIHVLGDALIAIAYFTIPPVLLGLRRFFEWQVPRTALFLFGAFIVSCGITHVMDIVVLIYPLYWAQGVLKLITAAISLTAGMYLFSAMSGVGRVVRIVEWFNPSKVKP